jgi:CheY-like chemotaxis protein
VVRESALMAASVALRRGLCFNQRLVWRIRSISPWQRIPRAVDAGRYRGMSDWVPYLGPATVILVGTAALILLARYGLRLRRFKHNKTQIEFDISTNGPTETEVRSVKLTKRTVSLTSLAIGDCKSLEIDVAAVVDFVVTEAFCHPRLFQAKLFSLPLLFSDNVLLLSWDGAKATVERLLNRAQAYPLNESWTSCLAAYRQATLLPYRSKGPVRLYTSMDAKRAISSYRRMIDRVEAYLSALREYGQKFPDVDRHLNELLQEAEFAAQDGDMAVAIARMEAVLSMTHKFIIQFAPSGPLAKAAPISTIPEIEPPPTLSSKTVLLVDDQRENLQALALTLRDRGFSVVTAGTTGDALRALVENEFDFVITDLVMGNQEMDGREVVFAARKSSPRVKIAILTAFARMSSDDLLRQGVNLIISKGTVSGQNASHFSRPTRTAVEQVVAFLEGETT